MAEAEEAKLGLRNAGPEEFIEEEDDSHKMTMKDCIQIIIEILFVIFVLITTTVFVLWSFRASGFNLFAWHPAAMSVGTICLMTLAISSFSTRLLRILTTLKYRVTLHWILQTSAVISIAIGSITIVVNKELLGKSHLQSNHAICGAVAFLCIVLSIVIGILTNYSVSLRHHIRPILLKVIHTMLGISAYILCGATLILGLYSHWFTKFWVESDRIFGIIAICVIWAVAIYRPMGSLMRRLINMCSAI